MIHSFGSYTTMGQFELLTSFLCCMLTRIGM
ncbi:hypothetical protein F383_13395 [Gossypium arboreum]|uniref:Uncharacterized protein n=1 Tax=Gossypium arboreum TaxID=29729 RepID=A0A0B0NAF1_GOSAR|nr:hypothetical protein F383_13395 [Gossypium arboreum]